ncbi:putative disease resistance protein RGA4 [Hordeum vulgare]|nr:putative disease resistance protein RGA4 [Hordeum vulgare]
MCVIMITVLGWLAAPLITLLLPKLLVCLGFDASNKLQDMEIHIIPELKMTLQALDKERMMQRGKIVKTDLDALDKMAAMLSRMQKTSSMMLSTRLSSDVSTASMVLSPPALRSAKTVASGLHTSSG